MSASTAGAAKAYLETHTSEWQPVGMGIPIYRDGAAAGAVLPYVVLQEGLGNTPLQRGDNGRNVSTRELLQGDLYQPWRKEDGTMAEAPQVANKLALALNGVRLRTAPNLVYGVQLFSGPVRTPDDDENVIRNTITWYVDRKLS